MARGRGILLLALWMLALPARGEEERLVVERPAPDDQRVAFVVDFDDNFLIMPTQIYLFRRDGSGQFGVSTAEYARVATRIGRGRSFWSRFELNFDLRAGSFREFTDTDPRLFFRHLDAALRRGAAARGRSWRAIVRALGNPRTAADFHVLSARAHLPQTGLAGFAEMRERGYFPELPLLDHLHFVGNEPDIAAAKARELFEILDGLQAAPFTERMWEVTHRNGYRSPDQRYHLFGFSDDDMRNVDKAVAEIGAEMVLHPGRWSHVKMFFYYTGPEPRTYVMRDDGTLRETEPREFNEGPAILRAQTCRVRLAPQ